MKSSGVIKIASGLQNFNDLTLLSFSNNRISEAAADDIANVLAHNVKLQELSPRNNLQALGAMKIAMSLQNNVSGFTTIDFTDNDINDEVADDIAVLLSYNNTIVQKLYI